MNLDALSRAVASVMEGDSRLSEKGDKRSKKKRRYRFVFPMLFPSRLGTPRTFSPGTANGDGGDGGGNGGGEGGGEAPMSPMGANRVRPSRLRVMHELKRSLGLLEYFSNHSFSSSPNPAWGGYSVPNFGMVKMRGGGPTIGGPGFQHDGEGKGGRYDFRKSPGLGFRSESAWRVWGAALDLMDKEPAMPKHSILLRAMAKAGVHTGQMDPAEMRLVEMGIEWYLTDPGSLAAKRGGGYAPYSGGPTDAGGTLSGSGAP